MSNYNIHELEKLANTTTRTIRYYIQLGLVDRPLGTKKLATYSNKHLEQLLCIKQWKAAGLNLSRIANLLARKIVDSEQPTLIGDTVVICRIALSAGISLDINRHVSKLSEQELQALCKIFTQTIEHMEQGRPEV